MLFSNLLPALLSYYSLNSTSLPGQKTFLGPGMCTWYSLQTLARHPTYLGHWKWKKSESEVTQSCLTIWDPMDCSLPGSSVHGISRQEYWSGLLCPPPGDLPNPGNKLRFPALQEDSVLSEPSGHLGHISNSRNPLVFLHWLPREIISSFCSWVDRGSHVFW